MSVNSSAPIGVDEFLFDTLHETSDVILQGNILDALMFRTKTFGYHISISGFDTFIKGSLERIYKYSVAAAVFKECYDPLLDDKDYEKRFYPLLIDELEFCTGALLQNIFVAFRIAYPDDPDKKFFFKRYYYDMLSTERVRKDNATTVLEQILPKELYIGMYDLFAIEDFENTNKDRDFKDAVQRIYKGFGLEENELLEFLKEEDDPWLNKIIVEYGEGTGDNDMLESMDRVKFLKGTEVFGEVSGEVLFMLAEKAKDTVYQRGDYILKEGDVVDSLFVIYKGEVEVLIGGNRVAVLGEKESLGEMEIFRDVQDRFAVAAVRAKSEEVVCIRVRKNDFDEVFDTNPELARALIKSLGDRLERMNARVREMEAD